MKKTLLTIAVVACSFVCVTSQANSISLVELKNSTKKTKIFYKATEVALNENCTASSPHVLNGSLDHDGYITIPFTGAIGKICFEVKNSNSKVITTFEASKINRLIVGHITQPPINTFEVKEDHGVDQYAVSILKNKVK